MVKSIISNQLDENVARIVQLRFSHLPVKIQKCLPFSQRDANLDIFHWFFIVNAVEEEKSADLICELGG